MDTLSVLEQIEVDNKDRPIEDIKIQSVQVFVDPYQEVDEQVCKFFQHQSPNRNIKYDFLFLNYNYRVYFSILTFKY